jgi:hypothetical protein
MTKRTTSSLVWMAVILAVGVVAPTVLSLARRQVRRTSEEADSELAGCANQMLRTVVSPDGQRKAVVFERNCGATTDFSTQVSILPRRARLRNVAGNTFIADTDHGAAPEGPGSGPEVRVVWESGTRLLIKHHPRARVFRSKRRVASVAVRYMRE